MRVLISVIAGILGILATIRKDAQRRKIGGTLLSETPLVLADIASPAAVTGGAVAALSMAITNHSFPLFDPFSWCAMCGALIMPFLWIEGRHQIQFQRPTGIIFGEACILISALALLISQVFLRGRSDVLLGLASAGLLTGGMVILVVVPSFLKGGEARRILERLANDVEIVQEEYVPATEECPHPEWWHMVDSKTSEIEVLDFLKSLVITVKPRLVVETGTFIGHSALRIAEGLKENGFGRVITIEYDSEIFAAAKRKIDASAVAAWIECRNASSLETRIEGMIDIFFSDSTLALREPEIRHFLPQIDARGVILVHDASSHFGVVRDAVLKLEAEGLLSVVLLSTPRGLVVAQKREGRK